MRAPEKIKEFFNLSEFDVAIVGGSGIDIGKGEKSLPYSEIPGMPLPKVPGHKGNLKLFEVGEKKVLFFEGRFHYYEGRQDWELRYIPWLCSELGVKLFIPTCASGAVSRKAAMSSIGIIYDHINLLGRNPLVGLIGKAGEKVFVNGKEFYDQEIVRAFMRKALELKINASKVVLAATLGPNYETFAEVRLLEILGADCVSMSTVPEVIASKFYGMRACALTVITNDTLNLKAEHKEVLEESRKKGEELSRLLEETLKEVEL
ncbi:purine-nucleoside phosphorylase [Thermovibrio sp.]